MLGAANLDSSAEVFADSFIYITPAHGTVTIINCESEGFLSSINVSPSESGNIGWPILVLNSSPGLGVNLSHNCDYVSIGNRYLPGAVQCANNGNDVMIYSFGDIFAPNETDLPSPDYDFILHGNSRVVTRANRYRVDFQRPARFGGQAGPNPPVLNNVALAVASLGLTPLGDTKPQTALCNPAGEVLFHVRADSDFIYFEDPRTLPPGTTPKKLMRLDRNGNMTIRGSYSQNPNL